MRRLILTLSIILGIFVLDAQDTVSLLDRLISAGNTAYELNQKQRIKECADSVTLLLDSGNLSGDELKDYAYSVYKLWGNFYYEDENFPMAELCYLQALSIIENNPETDFKGEDKLLIYRELAQLYYRMRDYQKALSAMMKADTLMEETQRYEVGGEEWLITKLTLAMCLARVEQTDEAIEIAEYELKHANDKSSLKYAQAQRMYAKILLLAEANKIGALKAYKAYFNKQKQFAKENFSTMSAPQRDEYWHALQPFIADCYLLEDTDPGFLYDITLFSKGLLLQLSRLSGDGKASASALKTLDYQWKDIQKKLKKDEGAIEFIQYGDTGDKRMAALLLKSKGTPQFIPLINPDEVLDIYGADFSFTGTYNKDWLYSDTTLQNMIWPENLLNTLKGLKKVYFAPDGYLHRIAMEYMPQVKEFDLYRLTSTRRLMEPKTILTKNSPVLLCGDINYNLDESLVNTLSNDSQAFLHYIGYFFPRLEESTDETKAIFNNRDNPADLRLSGNDASESAFRRLAPNYSSIIVATHGAFCGTNPLATDLKPVLTEDILSQSMMAFSGINSHLSDMNFDYTNFYDGILSAKEISSMDLSQCKLFTASACQTALGEISSDGVFGLQRGLKNAGVDAMLLSLWNVNSEATSILMTEFYRNLNNGMSIKNAFNGARQKLLDDDSVETISYYYDPAVMAIVPLVSGRPPYNTPVFTDAFILIDVIE